MASVVQQSDTTKQAVLMVDDEGYLLVTGAGGGSGPCPTVTKEVIKEKIVTIPVVEQVEVVKEVPVEVIKQVFVEKPVEVQVEVIKEIPYEVRVEVIKEVEGPERIVYQDKIVEVIKEVVKTEVKEIIKEKPVYPSEEELDALLAQREAARQAAIRAAEEEARRRAEEEARNRPKPVAHFSSVATGARFRPIGELRGSLTPAYISSDSMRNGFRIGGRYFAGNQDISTTEAIPYLEMEVTFTRRGASVGTGLPWMTLNSRYMHHWSPTSSDTFTPPLDTEAGRTGLLAFPEATVEVLGNNTTRGYSVQNYHGTLVYHRTGVGGGGDTGTTAPRALGPGEFHKAYFRATDVPAGTALWYWNAVIAGYFGETSSTNTWDISVRCVAFDKKPRNF